MTTSVVTHGFAEEERAGVGSLYWNAFRRKLRPAFPDSSEGLAVVQAAMRPDRTLVARVDGDVVGACGYYQDEVGAADLSWKALRRRLSVLGAVRAVLALSVLSRRSRTDIMVLDGICVREDQRGQGIGTILLTAALDHARQQGLRAVQLSVVDTNPRAESLYRRLGFTTMGGGSLDVLAPVYGFDRHATLERSVNR